MEYYRLTIPIPKKPWLWIRFRIGTIMLLVAILAILLTWRRDHNRLVAEIAKLRYPYPRYEAIEATGPPNVRQAGDSSNAWCPATMSGGKEWLELQFDPAVAPSAIVVHENYAAGYIVRIAHVPVIGPEVVLWEGTYTPTPGLVGAITKLPIENSIKTGRIKIYFDTTNATGWEEIDAVGLVDAKGTTNWAVGAKASSTWSQSPTALQPQMYSSQPGFMIIE
jgi:hypothetical protein